MILRSLVCLASTALLSITPAAAQQADTLATSLRPGAQSLSFALSLFGGGGGSAQYWRMRSERTNLGLMISLQAVYNQSERNAPEHDDETSGGLVDISAGPALRRYATTTSRVNPFLYGHALAGYRFRSNEGTAWRGTYTEHGVTGVLASGIGAEWFPVRSVSFSAQTGLQLQANYMFGEGGPESIEAFTLLANTFTSSVFVNFYWPQRAR